MQTISITQPDDWHLHLRDSNHLRAVVNDSARQFARAIVMPNLNPPVTHCEQALAYRERIFAAIDADASFDPLMTLYLTDNTSTEEIRKASESSFIHAAKLYPAGATTNSDAGVTHIDNIWAVLEAMQKYDFPLLVHGEATADHIDIFDREKVFIENTLEKVRRQFPQLRIVFEHITTTDAVDYVLSQDHYTGGYHYRTHLLINRNALFKGGMNPHHYCLPIVKRETHRLALLKAASQHADRFFVGTDSAPHAQGAKESACGCAGIYTAHAAIELYAEAFEQAGDMTQFEQFMSLSGPAFYGLPINADKISLTKQDWKAPDSVPFGEQTLIPFRAGQNISWKLNH